MKGKVLRSIVLIVSIMLVFAGGANASDLSEIPWAGLTSLPDYIGTPAKAHPTANSGVPQDPYLAPYPFPHGHLDIWMSDTADIAGPLGRNPVTLSSTLAEAHQNPNSWLIPCESIAFDSHGRPIMNCIGVDEASIIMVDPDTLEGPPFGEGDQQMLPSLFSIYGYLDDRDLVHIVSGNNKIITLGEAGPPSSPVFEQVGEGYDLSQIIDGVQQRISGAMMDFQGRYWLNMGTSSRIYLLNPATAKDSILDLPYVDLGEGEFTRNGLALTKEGAAYIVTTKAMYRVDAGADDQPHVVWRQPYNTIGEVRSGQYELGSGTTPTVLGEGKYVAITDNAVQMHVVVYRTATDEELEPDQNRIVCEVPVFDFPGGGAGALSNSLIGSRLSIIVNNNYDYLFDWGYASGVWGSPTMVQASAPGFERIDIDPNGNGCHKVWVNRDVASTASMRLSTRTGLIYVYARKFDAENDVYVYYWTALDFRTGEVVWEKLAGTGDMYDNFYAAIGFGPNGALYIGVYGGLISIRDTP
jgi:hypothetical protein